VLDKLARHLEEHYGCEVVATSGNLSDRKRLVADLDGMAGVEAYLTEIKAAAVDVVTQRGSDEGKPVVYCDNEPVGERLDAGLLRLAREAVAEKSREPVVGPERLVYNIQGPIRRFRNPEGKEPLRTVSR
jgi:cyclic 2,3-diphosphoglycerate synthetase